MDSSCYNKFHFFFPNMAEATEGNPCEVRGYTKYEASQTHRLPSLNMTVDLYVLCNASVKVPTVPLGDACGSDCIGICRRGLGRKALGEFVSCQKTCVAQSIMTNSSKGMRGKSIQKVMSEYCEHGVSGVRVSLHEVRQHVDWPFHQATPKPSSPPPKEHYCEEMCGNLYHPATSDSGAIAGTENPTVDKPKCVDDCRANWADLKLIYDSFCECISKDGKPFLPTNLAQQEDDFMFDVGSFIELFHHTRIREEL